MGELGDALASRRLQDEQARLVREGQKREAVQRGAELAREFIATAQQMGIEPDKILEHVTFYYREHLSAHIPSKASRSRDKDISRVQVAECWSIYGYLLTTDGHKAVPIHQRSEVRKRLFGKPYSIGEDSWRMDSVLSTETVYTTSDHDIPLKDAMAQYLDSRSRH